MVQSALTQHRDNTLDERSLTTVMLGRRLSREALIVQQERRAKRIRVRRVTQNRTNHKAILEVPRPKFQSEPNQTGESYSMIATALNANADMVFPRTTFPCHENSTLHLSPTTVNSKRFRNNPLSSFNGDFTGKSNPGLAMKRACTDDVYIKPEEKKRCLDSLFRGKEEVSEADFQMALIRQTIARKKDWVYSQVLHNLGLATPLDTNRVNHTSSTQRGGAENYYYNKKTQPFVHRIPNSAQQSSFSGFIKDEDSKKVHDEDGNCYIDSDDYMSFYRPKGPPSSQGITYSRDNTFNGHIKQDIKAEFDKCDTTAIPKRGLFLTLRINGGVAIDHDSMPKIAAIHSQAIKTRREQEALRQRHVEAKITGSTYRATKSRAFKTEQMTEETNITKEETKWWPPSPESMPDDVMSRDTGEGLLKVMTPDDMKAYGLPKKEENNEVKSEGIDDDDDDVIVTKVKIAPNSKHMDGMNVNELPPLQLDANGKAANYKEILLHYISQKLKNDDTKNTCLESISSVAERPRRKMSMDELCTKLKDTREKLEKEQLKWKRKLLSSLEVVLIKKIRRLEKETGEAIPEGIVLEGAVKDKQQEGTTTELNKESSIKGSNTDIVAIMEDLTSDAANVQSVRCKQRQERNSHSVSNIRGYESS